MRYDVYGMLLLVQTTGCSIAVRESIAKYLRSKTSIENLISIQIEHSSYQHYKHSNFIDRDNALGGK